MTKQMDPKTHGKQKGKAKLAGAFIAFRGFIGILILGVNILSGFQLVMILQLGILAGYLVGGLGVIADLDAGYIIAGIVVLIDTVLALLAFSLRGMIVNLLIGATILGGYTSGKI
jgi:hypothetical protein